MLRAIALGWYLAIGLALADAPMDLDLPFFQTALIQEKTGEITEKPIHRGKAKGDFIELEKKEGGLLAMPRKQLLAVLPQLPPPGSEYLQSDAQRALRVLQEAQTKFSQRPEVSPEAMTAWQRLGSAPTEFDKVQSFALNEWLQRCAQLGSDPEPDVVKKLSEEGNTFLAKLPNRAKEIERELEGLKDLGGIDLRKIDSIPFGLGPLGDNMVPGLVLWALLFIPLALALKAFPEALQGFRDGLPLAGGIRLFLGGLVLAFFILIFIPKKEDGAQSVFQGKGGSAAARRAGWFLLNHQERWSNQGAKKILLPASDWLAFLEEKVFEGSGADAFPFWYLAKPKVSTTESSLFLFQPVRANLISLPLLFIFTLPQPGQSLNETELIGAFLGKIPLGVGLGQRVWQIFEASYRPLAERCGINQGVRWLAGEGGMLAIEIPPTQKLRPKAKESLSAKELAEVFEQGFGEIYEGKVITIEGDLVGVSSVRESLGQGTGLEKRDPMDEFILEGIPANAGHPYESRIRCQFKSSRAYLLDAKGDLYQSAPESQDPSSDIPILRRMNGVTRVRIQSGRVESNAGDTRLITLYDCRAVEGFDGSHWIPIWGSPGTP